ncbi:TroA family protein [Paenibacillus profundus]|nr:hypothetical protein [Paenibacillus profundus]
MEKLGEVLGKEGESQTLLDNFYAKVEQSKQKLQKAGILDKTVTIMEGVKGAMGVMTSKGYGRGSQVIYEYLGMKAPRLYSGKLKNLRTMRPARKFPSRCCLSMPVMFRSAYEGMEDLSDNVIWNSIPAVKEGQLIEISFGLFFYNDIYSLDKQLDFVVDSLLETVK